MKKIAIPSTNNLLGVHFGHCEHFYIYETGEGEVKKREIITPPPHQPDLYPDWLNKKNVTDVIAGGMGQKAQDLFAMNNIEVYVGITADSPQKLVQYYLDEQLETGDNLCDH